EDLQALNLLSMYLDQFKRGWSYTAVYLLRDRPDEGGNQTFGFFKPDYSPRKAAVYLHNLSTILADRGTPGTLRQLNYNLREQPPTVHDLLPQKSDGSFALVIWDERRSGADDVVVDLGGRWPVVTVFDPTIGTEPVRSLADVDSIRPSLSDHPFIIAIRP